MEDQFHNIMNKSVLRILNEIPVACQIIVDEGGNWDVKEFKKIWTNKATLELFKEDGLGHYARKLPKSKINSLQAQWNQVKKAIREGSKGFIGPFANYITTSDNSIITHEYHILLLDEIEGGYRTFFRVTTEFSTRNKLKTNTHKEGLNPWAKLSGRELEIVKLISKGFPTKVIADKLSVSERTVDNHRTNIRKKLQLPRMTPLAKFLSAHIPE